MIKVFQIRDQEALYPAVTFTYGMGDFGFKPVEHIEKYQHVADLDVEDLDQAFEVGNIGPEEKYTRYAPMHSVSVGDILEKDGVKFVVAPSGFDQLNYS